MLLNRIWRTDMAKILKLSVIWFIVLIVLFIPFMIVSNSYQKWINVVEDELFAIYQDYMPLSNAISESIGAYTFYREMDQVKLKVGDHFRLFFAEAASKDAEKAKKFMPFFGISSLLLIGIGFIALFVLLILGAMSSIKTKRVDARYFKPSLVLFLGIGIVIGIFSYQSSLESKALFSIGDRLYDIRQYATNIIFKFIELSNIFYEVSVIEETQERGDWLPKMVLAKKKNELLLNELNSIKRWTVPKDSHFPKYDDTVSPAIEICKRLKKFFELSTSISSNIAEINMAKAESYAEFSELLEKLPNALKGVVKYNDIFMKYIFEFNLFDKNALANFQSIDKGHPDTKYNVKLLFGYTVYREINKKAEAEEAYKKKAGLLKNK